MQYAEMEEVYRRWCREATEDTDVALELKQMEQDPEKIEDAFYRSLSFGTGGLRGLIGAGTNRMNLYTVAQATQGAADYICAFFPKEKRRVAVSYDSRIKSRLFAETAAQVLAANGVEVKLFSRLMPTPCLSFAVRRLSCCLGIMITSSHNPARYNGYKVYGADGCQITSQAAGEIFKRIGRLDVFRDVKRLEFEEAVKGKLVSYVGEDTVTAYVEAVKAQSLLAEQTPARRDMTIVYTPLNGTGLEPVTRVLKEKGYSDVHLVKEQEQPDGTFPTCPYPNPEVPESMDLGIALAERLGGELLLATDPDCDRVGIAVKDGEGGYRRLSANETGLLLLDYVCSRRQDLGTMPAHPVMAKTIVTTALAEPIAAHYGVQVVNLLTGFKYIGEFIGQLEAAGRESDFIFGFEESCGYLSGTYVRDKDVVNAALLIFDVADFYLDGGKSLLERLNELYETYGYCLETQHSYQFDGSAGARQMKDIMEAFRAKGADMDGLEVEQVLDYEQGLEGLPKSNVLKYVLKDGGTVILRPSGTEPKLKLYLSVSSRRKEDLEEMERQRAEAVERFMENVRTGNSHE